MNKEKYFLRIEFENCETICVSLGENSNSYIEMKRITDNVSIAYNEYGQHKTAQKTFIHINKDDLIIDKPGLFYIFNEKYDMWKRLQQYDDITNISFYKNDEQFDNIFVEWCPEDEEYNAYQKTELIDSDTIDISIQK